MIKRRYVYGSPRNSNSNKVAETFLTAPDSASWSTHSNCSANRLTGWKLYASRKNAEVDFYEAGHFVLGNHVNEIEVVMRDFLARQLTIKTIKTTTR